ncbi:hypothetical protein [Alkalihalobacillus pseudalcaliphilus]|uniref:hypothetical protein n=1 Tax=Alkalihalobacillus pseudalcaliphilus TaxID=79884 RepID=UPI00064DFB7F|nr:hypothetical protein AB990_05635 [Alkalihalobacillus pseudalcaliphilus]
MMYPNYPQSYTHSYPSNTTNGQYINGDRSFLGGFFPPNFPLGPGSGGPPFNPPAGPPFGQGPFNPPFGGGNQAQPPSTPPPDMSVLQSAGVTPFAVDPGAISGCMYRFTFIHLNNGQSFWFYPIFVGRTSVAGFRWNGFRWTYFGIDTNRIASFQCV